MFLLCWLFDAIAKIAEAIAGVLLGSRPASWSRHEYAFRPDVFRAVATAVHPENNPLRIADLILPTEALCRPLSILR
jgi:hypothetical protein